ncbi:MAG: methyltransferase domain-containing protein [Paracoccaceae bacterium]|jgi:SAM-dependent methyltransferase|nr:methyltransferase domain-containing protein [Paracoccaceae bacterium]
MADPFSDLTTADPAFIAQVAEALESRAAEPSVSDEIDRYLGAIDWAAVGLAVDIGAGTGPVARRIAERAPEAQVVAAEPAAALAEHGRARAAHLANLRFEARAGTDLGLDEGTVDLAVMHTVLSHVPEPAPLLAEAARVLRPGGRLVLFDGDFSKGSLAAFPGDPLDACAEYFRLNFVTHPYLCTDLARMAEEAGFGIDSFRLTPRLVRDGDGMMPWVAFTTARMVREGQIGAELADALVAEYRRRAGDGTLFGFQSYATLMAHRVE